MQIQTHTQKPGVTKANPMNQKPEVSAPPQDSVTFGASDYLGFTAAGAAMVGASSLVSLKVSPHMGALMGATLGAAGAAALAKATGKSTDDQICMGLFGGIWGGFLGMVGYVGTNAATLATAAGAITSPALASALE